MTYIFSHQPSGISVKTEPFQGKITASEMDNLIKIINITRRDNIKKEKVREQVRTMSAVTFKEKNAVKC